MPVDFTGYAGLLLVDLKGGAEDVPFEPPTEFCIFRFGKIETDKGTFYFDEKCADMIVADRARRNARVQIDYDHLAIKSEKPGDGIAAGWCDVEKRASGLWAVHVKWTPKASDFLKNGEYASISPFFGATKDSKKIVCLMNVAITNLPATIKSETLVAASRLYFETLSDGEPVGGVQAMIKHEGGKFVLYTKDGSKKIPGGEHATEAEAKKHEAAINISKARDAGHKIPKESTSMAHKLGGYLAARMKKDGMSMKALAEKCGLSEERLRALHDGEDPTPEEMKSIGMKGFGMKDGEIEESVDTHRASTLDNDGLDDDGDDDEDDEEDAADKKKIAAARRRIEERKARKPAARASQRREQDDELSLDLVELTGTTDRDEQRRKLAGVFAMAEQFAPVKKQLDQITAKHEETKRESLIKQGKEDGKLTPSLLRFWAKRSLAEFEEFLKSAPILSVENLSLREAESSQAAAVLTHEEIEVCRLSNTPVDTVAKFVQDERSGKNRDDILKTYLVGA
jgi:phage I-like protein